MTTIINLFAGPGAGKSTTAAELFVALKKQGTSSVELVQEEAKRYAWRGDVIEGADQIDIFQAQSRRENELLGKVDIVVTDSPLELGAFYSAKYAAPTVVMAIERLVAAYRRTQRAQGHHCFDYALTRTKPYDPRGRYQDAATAREFDALITQFMWNVFGVGLVAITAEELLVKYAGEKVANVG